jgi:hypothetical protein
MCMESSNLHPEHRDAQRVVSSKLQRYKDIQSLGDVCDSIQPEVVERVDSDTRHLHSEPTNVPSGDAKPDAILSSGVHGKHHSVNDEYVPKSIWQSGVVRRLADYIRQLREVDDQSNQRPLAYQSNQSAQPEQSGFTRHVCTRNPHRTCNCDAGVCADDAATYRYARGPFLATNPSQRVPTPKPNHLGNFSCPIDNKLCSSDVCNGWCKSSGPGAETDADRGYASTTINR